MPDSYTVRFGHKKIPLILRLFGNKEYTIYIIIIQGFKNKNFRRGCLNFSQIVKNLLGQKILNNF